MCHDLRVRLRVLPIFFLILACKPGTPLPERLILSTSALQLDWGEQQAVTARAFIGTKAQSIDGIQWTSADETIARATVDADGTATIEGVGGGETTITARLREASIELAVTVAPRIISLERIELTAPMTSIPRGATVQLVATGFDDDGSMRDLTASCAFASRDSTKATVNQAGLVTAVDVGTVELRALKSGKVGTLQLTITPATLVGIDVRPASTTLALGTTQLFTASGRYSDASTVPLGSTATWSSSDDTVVTVDATGRATARGVGTARITAGFDAERGEAEITVTAATLRSLVATPSSFTLPLGGTRAITIAGVLSDGTMQDLTSMATWRSGTGGVATVDSTGLVTAVGQGLSVITATVGAFTVTSSVTCTAPQLQAIRVDPPTVSVPRGLTRTLSAIGEYTDQTTRDLTLLVTWTSQDGGVATVNPAGVVRAVEEGVVQITASSGSLSGRSTVTVTPAIPLTLELSPPVVSLPAGRSRQLTATGTFSDGTVRDVTTTVDWTSQDAGVAFMATDAGTVVAVAEGVTTVDATLGLATAARVVTVTPAVLDRIEVTAASTSLAKGRTMPLTATGVYSDGARRPLTTGVNWSPSTGTTLLVSGSGVVTALQPGTASATATLGSVSGMLSITVTPPELEAITVLPPAPSIPLGLTRQLVAQGLWSDGSSAQVSTGVTWGIDDGAVASVSSSGLVTSLTQGSAVVTASVGSLSNTAAITVTAPVLVSIALTPSGPLTLDKTQTQQLAADGTRSDGTHVDVTTTASWSSSAPSVATVTDGLITAVAPGTSTLTATQGGVTATLSLSVNRPALASLRVTPRDPTVQRGATLPFIATATYVDASTEVVTSLVTWSSGTTAVATISAAGLVTGVAEGTSTISAGWNGQSDATLLSVEAPQFVTLSVSGPARFANGTVAKFTATGTAQDAGTTDVSDQVTWSSSASGVIAFTQDAGVSGFAQGLSAGTANVTASLGALTSAAVPVAVLDTNAPFAGRCGTGLVISQVYGAGGNSGATLRNDFVELHNPTPSPVSLSGLSLQYTSSTGSSWGTNMVALSNTVVPAGGYYLVLMNSGGSVGATVSGDQTATAINMSGTGGKIALASVTTGLSGNCPTTNVLDLVGFGTTADCFEGARAPAPSATTAIIRGTSGCRDTNQNSTDFTVTSSGSITPRSLATTAILCSCSANGVGAPAELNACQLLSTANLTVSAATAGPLVRGSVTQPGATDGAGFAPSLRVQVGWGPVGASPATGTGWQWWPTSGATAGTTSDEYEGLFLAPASGSWSFTTRASTDGVNWTVCDLNGAGSGSGLALEPGQLGALTVP